MLSSSSSCKNKEVLIRNGGEKWKLFINCVDNMSLLNMTLIWSLCRVRIFSLCHFASMGLGNLFASHLIINLINMTFDPMLCQMLPKSRVVLTKCSREFIYVFLYPLYIVCFSTTLHSYYILCFVSMMWDSLWPSFDGSLPIDFSSLLGKMI